MRLLLYLLLILGSACSPVILPAGTAVTRPELGNNTFTMADGAMLPYRAWLPEGKPTAMILGLHGFGDYSVNYLDLPAPLFTSHGIALYSYDQRGFGASPNRGYWPGAPTLASDAVEVARLLHGQHPDVPLYMMGESMGVAVLLVAASGAEPPPAAGYILQSPALRGRRAIGPVLTGLLEAAGHTVPSLSFRNASSDITPTDNVEAMRRWSRDPLTTKQIRVDALYGLVGLMDEAVDALPRFRKPALVLYGGRDDLVPASIVRRTLRSMASDAPVRVAFYPQGFHLLLRDLERAKVAADILAWIADHHAELPSGAEMPMTEETMP